MRIAIAILLCLMPVSTLAADLPVKVYSASELQKISDGVYRSLNNRGNGADTVELLQNQLNNEPDRSASLRQIEEAFANHTADGVRNIYYAATSAQKGADNQTVSPKPSAPSAKTVPTSVDTSQSDTTTPEPMAEVAKRRPNRRLDAWLERQSSSDDRVDSSADSAPVQEPQSMTVPAPTPLAADVAATVLAPLPSNSVPEP